MNMRLALMGFVIAAPIYGAAGQEPPRDPAAPPAPQRAGEPTDRPGPEDDRASLKARLERRLAESKLNQERVEKALKMLDSGEDLEKIRQEANPGLGRPDRPGREGQPRDGQNPRRRDGRQGPPGDVAPPPGPPDAGAILDMIRQANPELYQRIEDARKESPEAADRIIQRVAPHMRELMAERDPEMRRLRLEDMRNNWEWAGAIRDLAGKMRAGAAAEEIDAATGKVGALLGTHFDIQVKLHEREISVLEDRLAKVRKEMAEQSSGREAFVKEKLDQILSGIKDRIEREKKGEAEPPRHRDGAGRPKGAKDQPAKDQPKPQG